MISMSVSLPDHLDEHRDSHQEWPENQHCDDHSGRIEYRLTRLGDLVVDRDDRDPTDQPDEYEEEFHCEFPVIVLLWRLV